MNIKIVENLELMNGLAVKLARIHHLKPPIKRKGSGFLAQLQRNINLYTEALVEEQRHLFSERKLKALLEFEFKAEYEWIYNIIESANYTKVFAHKDFRFGNFLVTECEGIVVTDFDFASYDDRGYDFAELFYDMITSGGSIDLSNEKYMKIFIRDYINECNQLNGKTIFG